MPKAKAKQEELPGMEARDVPEIEQAADRYRQIRDERCALSKEEAEAKAALIQVMKNKGRTYYSYNGLNVQLSNQENVKVKSKDEDDEEPTGTFKQPRRARAAEIAEKWMNQAEEFIEQQAEAEQVIDTSLANDFIDEAEADLEANREASTEAERERLHREAVATWRRERPASIEDEAVRDAKKFSEIMAEDDDGGGTPFPTEYPQAEINRMAEFCAADQIGDKKKSVKICYVSGEPHAITGAAWKGANCMEVDAWPILPLANVGKENAKDYDQVSAEYNKQFDEGNDQDYKPLSYQDIKINCGSVKKPDWWVMVGPEIVFKVDHSAAYPDDEIEAMQEEFNVCGGYGVENGHEEGCPLRETFEPEDSFTAPRCDEYGRIDGGHTQECSKSNALRFEDYLAYAEFAKPERPKSWARKWELSREMDGPVMAWKLYQANNGIQLSHFTCKCGHSLEDHRKELHGHCQGTFNEEEECDCVKFIPTLGQQAAGKEKKPKKGAKLSPVEAAIDR